MSFKSYNRPMTHQEYLKTKYMSQDDYEPQKVKKKKVKKSTITKAPTVKIIDDDVDFRTLAKRDSDDEELYFGTKEEKPIIEAVIDERPLHMRTDVPKGKWKVVGDDDTAQSAIPSNRDRSTSHSEKESSSGSSHSKAKTLGGKKAGLSNAKDIKKELVELKRKNDKLIENLTDDISGKNAQTVFRDRSTGKVRSIEKELEEKAAEAEKKALEETEKKAVYNRWSKGLVQRQEQIQRIEDDLHEMNKPLARHADDADLDHLLRQRERTDDPMLMELRKKKREEEKATNPNYVEYPKYRGPPPPPNRFGIAPGYRWDGVDRSNGYEAKIFTKAANREAMQEEAYRWSTQDM